MTCHIALLLYNRIIRADSAPNVLSPIAVAFGLVCGLSYAITLLSLPSTASWFIYGMTDHTLGVESTAFF